ncbi:unnamed protein product [Amoebophrya sp. A25]|nr:unnamed protein product [Amoebophrya sp. A25]|eukprot:GSA25T00009851001.1
MDLEPSRTEASGKWKLHQTALRARRTAVSKREEQDWNIQEEATTGSTGRGGANCRGGRRGGDAKTQPTVESVARCWHGQQKRVWWYQGRWWKWSASNGFDGQWVPLAGSKSTCGADHDDREASYHSCSKKWRARGSCKTEECLQERDEGYEEDWRCGWDEDWPQPEWPQKSKRALRRAKMKADERKLMGEQQNGDATDVKTENKYEEEEPMQEDAASTVLHGAGRGDALCLDRSVKDSSARDDVDDERCNLGCFIPMEIPDKRPSRPTPDAIKSITVSVDGAAARTTTVDNGYQGAAKTAPHSEADKTEEEICVMTLSADELEKHKAQMKELHFSEVCKPCGFFWKSFGCKLGDECHFCHICTPEQAKARKARKIAELQMQARLNGKPITRNVKKRESRFKTLFLRE